jgi:hypothetical protein
MEMKFDLPVKIGDAIFEVELSMVVCGEVTGFSYGHLPLYDFGNVEDGIIVHYKNNLVAGYFPVSEIGKTVFLSYAEARNAQKTINGEV